MLSGEERKNQAGVQILNIIHYCGLSEICSESERDSYTNIQKQVSQCIYI